MNVSESVKRLLAEREVNAAERNRLTGLEKKSAGDQRQRTPSGRDLRRWARGQERAGRREQKPLSAASVRQRRKAKPNARELFPVLQAKRLAARPVAGYAEDGRTVFGPSTFRNVIDANGKHI